MSCNDYLSWYIIGVMLVTENGGKTGFLRSTNQCGKAITI